MSFYVGIEKVDYEIIEKRKEDIKILQIYSVDHPNDDIIQKLKGITNLEVLICNHVRGYNTFPPLTCLRNLSNLNNLKKFSCRNNSSVVQMTNRSKPV